MFKQRTRLSTRFLCRVVANTYLSFASATAFAETAPDPVLVYSGGFGSCRSSSASNSAPYGFQRMHEELAASLGRAPSQLPWVVSCFRAVDRTTSVVEYSSNVVATGSSLPEFVSQILAAQRRPVLIGIGHSWGGLLAAESAAGIRGILSSWAQDPRFAHLARAKTLLVTLDAIDYNLCKQPPLSVLSNPECQRAPRAFDIGTPTLARVTQSVDGWLNIYQTQGLMLRSGPIAALQGGDPWTANTEMSGLGLSPHVGISQDARVWSLIKQLAAAFLR